MGPPSQGIGDAVGPPPEVGGGEGPQHTVRSCVVSQLRKTRLCKYSPKGTCKYGSQCTYAHSETELHASPDLSKTRLCTAFQLEGWCNDASCMFAHGEEELRSTNMFYRKTLCIWNERGPGHCRNGDKCRFAHGREQLQRGPEDGRPRQPPPSRAAAERQPARGHGAARAAARPAPQARPEARGVAAAAARPPPPLAPGGLLCDSPMKVYPVAPSGDEHPASASMAAAYAAAAAGPSMPNIAQQLESLCHQITALTVQCNRMSMAGGGGQYPRSYSVGYGGGDPRAPLPIHHGGRGALGGAGAGLKPFG